jgi:hypothetical protein
VTLKNGQKALKKLLHWATQIKGVILATPNYGFEKRQKELAKKRKKEDKLKAKSDRKSGLFPDDGSDPDAADETDAAAAPDAAEAQTPPL